MTGHSMTSMTRTEQLTERAKVVGLWMALALAGFLIGSFLYAPNRHRAQPSYLPASYMALATGMAAFETEEGVRLVIPVRVADTSSSRLVGFRDVGEDAIRNQFLLYAQSREVAARTGYTVERARVPLEFAAIAGDGRVLSITTSSVGQQRVTIPESHRWVLAAKSGTFAQYGIAPGMTLDPESVRKLNL